jgi:hypothetical protein
MSENEYIVKDIDTEDSVIVVSNSPEDAVEEAAKELIQIDEISPYGGIESRRFKVTNSENETWQFAIDVTVEPNFYVELLSDD